MPPTTDEIERFLNDKDVNAYETMVESYLVSIGYGERRGKYWLDAAGYADSNGYFGADTDRPFAYRYRDYVIRSINADKPLDQFIREQIAGDELVGYQRGGDVHPELIDYLAGQLIKHDWIAKEIHRLILHSSTYRQSSVPSADAERIDPDHRLLSRYPLRRMDGEAIRDAMLAVSGELEPAMFGPYVATERSPEGDVIVAENNPQRFRRSIYFQQRRTQVVGMLEVFDAPSIVFNCTVRPRTTE